MTNLSHSQSQTCYGLPAIRGIEAAIRFDWVILTTLWGQDV